MDIMKSITRHIGREISEHDISDLHRIHGPQTEANGGSPNRAAPNIVCRVNRRTVKHEVFANKKHLRSHPHPDSPNLGIFEDLTPLRSRMLYALRNRRNPEGGAKTFKYTWSKEGRLYCRTEEQTKTGHNQKLPKPGIVNRPQDLKKLGFNDVEIENIINNTRK